MTSASALLIKDVTTPQESIVCNGWIRSIRESKNFSFIMLYDGSCSENLQIILDKQLPNYQEVVALGVGASISITGKAVISQGKNQSIEIQAQKIDILGECPQGPNGYPLQKKSTSMEFLREVAHLRMRTQTFGCIYRLRHHLSFAIHDFFNKNSFFYAHTPIITASDCEGAGELFRVSSKEIDGNKGNFFGKETYLTVSGQLEGECMAMGLGRIYTFGPTFRAENSNTSRHLAEFWMIEPEVCFYDLHQLMNLASDFLKSIFKYVMVHGKNEIEFLQKTYETQVMENLQKVISNDFVKITYTQAIEILEDAIKGKKVKFEFMPSWGSDLQTEHERYITEMHFKAPVMVYDYPKEIKSFYMKENADKKTVAAVDVLVPGIGEIIGGSQREENYEKLKAKMMAKGMSLEEYYWYLDQRSFGSVVHSGFGMGFERAMMYITGMSNIRDVIPFARTINNAAF